MGRARQTQDPLVRWLSLEFTGNEPERSYYPELRDFLAEVLGYPREKVQTETRAGEGFADFVLLTPEGDPWVVGEFKKENRYLEGQEAEALWREKRKYITGFTRYFLFLTPHRLQLRSPVGEVLQDLYLPGENLEGLRGKLREITWEEAAHERIWERYTQGTLPYAYLSLEGEEAERLKKDLMASFQELSEAAGRALNELEGRYRAFLERRSEVDRLLTSMGKVDLKVRALARMEREFSRPIRDLFERHLPGFAEQYGREDPGDRVIREAFAADSAAALMARVLFLRFLEDLDLTRRRLTNGGPERWGEFMEFLAGRATALVKVASLDLAEVYRDPFGEETFSWVLEADGELDRALQRLLLRVNAYDFRTLSEEVLGDIYQSFLPPDKRKRLGEFYTPKEVVDLILRETALAAGEEYPRVLDPACGSGSFLVRYLHHRLQDAQERGVDLDAKELAESIWGFDLNPFASYISLFQLTWGLLRLQVSPSKKRRGEQGEHPEPPRVHVYNLNSLLDDREVAHFLAEHLEKEVRNPGEKERDEGEWDYVVGNPPYIRAERAKYGPMIKGLYSEVWGQNGDTGLLFLWRALRGSGTTEKPWVREGGRLGMVISGGYASSEAAAPVWRLLWPTGGYALRKLVWLEFAEENGRQKQVWDAARVPLVLIVERTPPREEDEVEVWVPSSWPKERPEEGEVARIPYRDFFDPKVNPSTNGTRGYGEYLLPLLREGDAPLLRKLYPNSGDYVPLTEAMEARARGGGGWTHGIQRGGVEITEGPEGNRPVPVLAGRGLAVAWPGEPVGYVDLEAVGQRPYGKPSLWRGEGPQEYLAVAKISLCPFGALVRSQVAAVDTLIVGVPKEGLGEAVAAYLSSSLARWYYAVRLRSGVVQGYFSAIYPRTLEALPWPREPEEEALERLRALYRELERLAAGSRDNPRAWLQKALEERVESGQASALRAPRFGLDFRTWEGSPAPEEVWVEGTVLVGDLYSRLDLKDPDLARFVHLVLSLAEAERVERRELQKLLIPHDYKDLLEEYGRREEAFSGVREAFLGTLREVDEAVFDLFRLDREERAHVLSRLGSFPLDRLRPRYPWEVGKLKPLKAYTEDRFR